MVIKILLNNEIVDFNIESDNINNVIERKAIFTFKINEKEKYFMIRNLAWQVLLDSGIKELPVDLYKIAKNYKCLLAPYQENMALFTSLENWDNIRESEAFSFNANGFNIIAFNNNYPITRTRFTLAHELGHLLLNHLANDLNTDELESEAHSFSARILMPVGVLNALNVQSPNEIARLCNTSIKASAKRFDRLQMLRERGKFYTSGLEKKL